MYMAGHDKQTSTPQFNHLFQIDAGTHTMHHQESEVYMAVYAYGHDEEETSEAAYGYQTGFHPELRTSTTLTPPSTTRVLI